jgi:hypothetical protein
MVSAPFQFVQDQMVTITCSFDLVITHWSMNFTGCWHRLEVFLFNAVGGSYLVCWRGSHVKVVCCNSIWRWCRYG